jgi:hypothetical protein
VSKQAAGGGNALAASRTRPCDQSPAREWRCRPGKVPNVSGRRPAPALPIRQGGSIGYRSAGAGRLEAVPGARVPKSREAACPCAMRGVCVSIKACVDHGVGRLRAKGSREGKGSAVLGEGEGGRIGPLTRERPAAPAAPARRARSARRPSKRRRRARALASKSARRRRSRRAATACRCGGPPRGAPRRAPPPPGRTRRRAARPAARSAPGSAAGRGGRTAPRQAAAASP